MKVIEVTRLGVSDNLAYAERPLPAPSSTQVRLQTVFTSVNFADIKARRGDYGQRETPFIPGLDASGVVDALGEEVTGFQVDERVAAYTTGGSYAEYVLADERLCFQLPNTVSFEQGAGIGILITAYNVLTLAGRFQPGESVLVHAGAGGVGSTLVQLAKTLGASRVFAAVGSEEKADIARRLGTDHVINYRKDAFDEVINDLTDGAGVDLILDSVSGETAERGLRCLAPFGRLVIYGHTGSGEAAIGSKSLHSSNRAVIGYSSGGFRRARPEVIKAAGEQVMKLLEQGQVSVWIGERFALKDATKAQHLVESRKSTGKVLLEP